VPLVLRDSKRIIEAITGYSEVV